MFKPDIWVKNVLEIDRDFLTTHHIRGLILDLDNTLSMHGSPAAEIGVEDWLDTMRANGVKMMVVSNNTEQRVEPLARQLGLEYVSFGCKPLPKGIRSAEENEPSEKIYRSCRRPDFYRCTGRQFKRRSDGTGGALSP